MNDIIILCIIMLNNLLVSLRVLYCVVNSGYGLGRSLGDCIPALQIQRVLALYYFWDLEKVTLAKNCISKIFVLCTL